jgi:lipoprotein-releasing system permease protein
MGAPYEVRVGLRYLRGRRRRGLSLIAAICMAGLALGVMALIVVLAVMTGFEHDLRAKILGVNAHLWILRAGERGIEAPEAIVGRVRATPGVIGAAPFVLGQVMVSGERGSAGAVVRGVDLEAEAQAADPLRHLRLGSPEAIRRAFRGPASEGEPAPILLGRTLAANLGAGVGDQVTLLSPVGGGLTPLGFAPRMRGFRVAGIFDVGMYEYDAGLAYVPLPAAQAFFRLGGAVTGIEVRLADLYRAGQAGAALERALGPPFYARDWMQMHRNIFRALKMEKVLMFLILVMIVLVAAFGIASNLIMTVMEKKREIAILKAMGATAPGLLRIFLVEGLVLGLVGTSLGLAGGLLVVWRLPVIQRGVEWLLGFPVFPADVYFLDRLPARILPGDVAAVVGVALLIAAAASLYPAWRAARLDPVAAIRYE